MKNYLKLISAILCLLMLLPLAASCAKSDGRETQTLEAQNSEENQAPESKGDLTMNRDLKYTPEEMGISSKDITAVLQGLKMKNYSIHSLLVMRKGEIVAEGYAEPIEQSSLHRMYSVSKSFAAIAIGVLEAEGKIDLNDTIDKYFPEYVTASTDQRVKDTRIIDLLRMMTPYNGDSYKKAEDMNWVKTYFTATSRIKKSPATKFCYDTSASHLLGAIVERETGMDFLEYLKEKALLEIGFSKDSWCVKAPEGYAWAGSGVMCTSRDLAAFANLVMHKGEHNGKQLLPRDYVEAATSYQVATSEAEGSSPYYGQGYGYQIWMNPYGFGFMGMGGQFALCVPEKDLIVVMTADTQGISDYMANVWELIESNIFKKVSDTALEEDSAAVAEMDLAFANMEIPYQTGSASNATSKKISGKTFEANDDGQKITSFSLTFNGDEGVFAYDTERGKKELRFGIGKNVICTLNEPQYSGELINHPNGEGYRSLCSGAWLTNSMFILKVQVVDDYFGNMTLSFSFSGTGAGEVSVTGQRNAECFLDEYKFDKVKYSIDG